MLLKYIIVNSKYNILVMHTQNDGLIENLLNSYLKKKHIYVNIYLYIHL